MSDYRFVYEVGSLRTDKVGRKKKKWDRRIMLVVLVETIWTLRGKKYQLKKSELVTVVQSLFKEPNIRFEDGQVVWLALSDYRNAKPVKGKEADFAYR